MNTATIHCHTVQALKTTAKVVGCEPLEALAIIAHQSVQQMGEELDKEPFELIQKHLPVNIEWPVCYHADLVPDTTVLGVLYGFSAEKNMDVNEAVLLGCLALALSFADTNPKTKADRFEAMTNPIRPTHRRKMYQKYEA